MDFLYDFVEYLKSLGYQISSDTMSRFFSYFSSEDLSILKEDDVLPIMQIVFAKTKEEQTALPEYFYNFIKDKEKIKKKQKEKEDLEAKMVEMQKQKELQIEVQKRKQKELDQARSKAQKEYLNRKTGITYTKKEQNTMEKASELLLRNKSLTKEEKGVVRKLKKNDKKIYDVTLEEIEGIMKKTLEIAQKEMQKGETQNLSLYQDYMKACKKVLNHLKEIGIDVKQYVEKQVRKEQKSLDEQQGKERELEEETKRIQRRLNSIIKESQRKAAEDSRIEKSTVLMHRPEFTGGYRSVYNVGTPDYLKKRFKQLNREEMDAVYRYLRENRLQFKTQLRREIDCGNRHELDIQKTILQTCKTGGIPLNLAFKEKQRNKTNLILILDVSGSCRQASEMMLMFMYLLQDVFPKGTTAYAFVDTLYDITDILKASNINKAINRVLDTIPRAGVYSNYYRPMSELWNKHHQVFKKDSYVIFMGDARNNKNASGEEFLKNIARRCRKALWMNTEMMEKWGQGDSIAPVYARYTKMHEVLNVGQLISSM